MGRIVDPVTAKAWQIIRAEYGGGENFMTPTVVQMGKVGNYRAWELSRGRGFSNETIWGVSVVDVDPVSLETTRRTDISQFCYTRAEAKVLIGRLKEIE